MSIPRQSRHLSLTQVAHRHLREAVHQWRTRHTVAGTAIVSPLLAIDATAGNGHDTLFLAQLLGVGGEVAAFDIQPQALENTRERLRQYAEGSGSALSPALAQVRLIEGSHAQMLARLPGQWQGAVCAITFNLGYLPGGDKVLVTLPQSTLQALEAALQLLAPGGLLSVLCYRGHPEGKSETDAIARWLEQLPEDYSHAFIHAAADAPPHAPVLLQIERNG